MTIHLLTVFLSAYPARLQKVLVDEETWENLNPGDLADKSNNKDSHKYIKEYIIMNITPLHTWKLATLHEYSKMVPHWVNDLSGTQTRLHWLLSGPMICQVLEPETTLAPHWANDLSGTQTRDYTGSSLGQWSVRYLNQRLHWLLTGPMICQALKSETLH